ncbi:hypothetical protein K8I85_01875, partial [bacterium]|nr:hypothetical protein [bacterium]
ASGPGFEATPVDVELDLDDHVVDRRRIDLGPSSRVGITFHETFAEDGIHLGSVAIRGAPGIPDDDDRPFTLRTQASAPLLVVCPDERSRRYLTSALAPGGGGRGSFAVRSGDVRELATASRARETVIVLADVERLAESELAGLKAFLSEGGGLLVLPGPRLDAQAWGRSFLPKFLPGTIVDLLTPEEPLFITDLDPSHALLALFRDGEGGLRDVRFTKALQLRPLPGTAVLASYGSGDPAVLESSLLPGRVLFLTSGLDPAWSDLPLTGSFVPLLHESVRYLSETAAQSAEELDVGQGATVRLPTVPDGGAVTLRMPGGTERSVAPEPGPGGYALAIEEAAEPGFWVFVSAAGDTLAALAAAIPSAESDPARVPVEELERRYGEGDGAVLDGSAGIERAVKEARIGREIGRWFLWMAALLLAAEMIIAARFGAAARDAAA